MIVKDMEQMQLLLPSFNIKRVSYERIASFLSLAQSRWVALIIGDRMEALLEEDVPQGAADPHSRLRYLAGNVIAVSAYLDAVPELDLQLSEAGFVVQNNAAMSPAFQQRVDRLIEGLKDRLDIGCNALAAYLLDGSKLGGPYTAWRETDSFAGLTEAFIPSLTRLAAFVPHEKMPRWPEFVVSVRRMSDGMRATAARYVSEEEIDRLLELYRSGTLLVEQGRVVESLAACAAEVVYGNASSALLHVLEARGRMLKNAGLFTAFQSSEAYSIGKNIDFGKNAIANGL